MKERNAEMKKVSALLVLTALVITLSGCETIKGFGEDVSTVGRWLTKGSEKAQNPK